MSVYISCVHVILYCSVSKRSQFNLILNFWCSDQLLIIACMVDDVRLAVSIIIMIHVE